MRFLSNRGLVVAGCFVLAGAFSAGVSAGRSPIAVGGGVADAGSALERVRDSGQGAAGGASATAFVCSQVTAMTLTREWFQAGFEENPGIANDRWQLKARQSGYITEWANPNSDFWNQAVQSPCANGSASPDHVVLTVLSWRPACCTTAAQWEAVVSSAVTNLKAKYAGLKRVDLMTVIRGPGNNTCPLPPVANEYIAMPAELDAGLAAVAAKFPNLVFVTPGFEAPSCSAFVGGGPHLTPAGNAEVAKTIAAYFAKLR
jgi:hypothetical protein